VTQTLAVGGILLLLVLTATSEARAQNDDYRIGSEDVLQISVWRDDGMSRTVPVRPDGMISLPLINDVRAVGLTPIELREVLMKKLADYLPTPEVSVIVTEIRSFKVSVMGEVKSPQRYDLKSWTTVLDVLAMAGGFTQFAARSKVSVLRREGTTTRHIPFNYPRVIAGQEEDFYLRPGDKVVVP